MWRGSPERSATSSPLTAARHGSARASVDEAIAGAEDAGRDAVDAVREVGDNFRAAVDVSLKQRPYMTLALAFALGFFFGATRR